MTIRQILISRWKLILNIVTIGALLLVIYAIRSQLVVTIHNFTRVNGLLLLLIIPVELLNYHAQARLYQRLFRIVGNKLSYGFLYKAALELNFVNHVFPSGGVTGISYFGVRMRDGEKITGGKATLIQISKLGLTFISFEILVIIGMFCLAIMGRVNGLTILVGGAITTLLLVFTIGFGYIVGSKERINSFFTAITEALNWVIHLVVHKKKDVINITRARGLFDDFHDNYQEIKKNLRALRAPFWYAFLANLTEVLAVYVVYMAFGKYVNFGAVILAYAVANFAGLISVLPGGVGVYEFLMTAVLISAGVPARVSIPITIMYRVVNTLIQIPPGYVLYQRNLNRTPKEALS